MQDRQTGTTDRVSVDATGVEGNPASDVRSISADGRYVAFYSSASNLVAGDTNGTRDVFQASNPLWQPNTPPTANATSGSGQEDGARVAIVLSGTDPDAGDAIDSFTLASLPANGHLYTAAVGGTQLDFGGIVAASGNSDRRFPAGRPELER